MPQWLGRQERMQVASPLGALSTLGQLAYYSWRHRLFCHLEVWSVASVRKLTPTSCDKLLHRKY